jgi:Ca2+-binding RTX toxin-like protein
MRQSIIFLALILLGLALYTVYGLVTYEPQRARPFVFADPVLPPELQADLDAAKAASIPLSAQQQEQATAAVAQISQAVTLYQTYEADATPQAAPTFELLNTAILNSSLPAYLLSQALDPAQGRSFELITLDPKKNTVIGNEQSAVNCSQNGISYDVIIGDNGNNRIECDLPASGVPLDRVFLGGPGNDTIISTAGNRIIHAGTGDDTITAGPGRTIILLDDAWGKDTLTVDCTATTVDKIEIPQGFPVPWTHQFTNFIVLGPSISRADVSWDGLVLTNKITGDTLSVNENCFNLISAAN